MNNKKQVVVIGGGEAWNTHEEYIDYLTNYDFTQEKFDKITSLGWKEQLQKNLGEDFLVIKPNMPNPQNAKYDEWSIWFKKLVPYLEDDCILVGHSLGANFLAKYCAENNFSMDISDLYLVAGCFGLGGGFDLPESLEKIEENIKNVYIYHSHDDPVVDFSDALKYKKALPKSTLIEFSDRNHFLQDDFPEIVESIKKSLL